MCGWLWPAGDPPSTPALKLGPPARALGPPVQLPPSPRHTVLTSLGPPWFPAPGRPVGATLRPHGSPPSDPAGAALRPRGSLPSDPVGPTLPMREAPTGRPSVPPSISPSVLLHPPPPRATRVRPSAEDSPPVSFSRLSVLSGKIRSIPMPCSRTGACHLGGPHSFVWDPSLLLAGAPSFTAPARSPVPRWSSVAELVCRRAGQCKALRVFRDSSEGLSRHGRGSGAPAPGRGRALCVFAAGPGRGDPSRGEQPENVGHQTRVARCPPRLMGRARSCDVPHTREQSAPCSSASGRWRTNRTTPHGDCPRSARDADRGPPSACLPCAGREPSSTCVGATSGAWRWEHVPEVSDTAADAHCSLGGPRPQPQRELPPDTGRPAGLPSRAVCARTREWELRSDSLPRSLQARRPHDTVPRAAPAERPPRGIGYMSAATSTAEP